MQAGLTGAVSALTTGGDAVLDGTPQAMMGRAFQSIGDGSFSRAMHSVTFPQAAMPRVDVKTSIEAGNTLRELMQDLLP
jgi:hypothetical protein